MSCILFCTLEWREKGAYHQFWGYVYDWDGCCVKLHLGTVLGRLSLLLLAITRLRGNLGQNSSPKTVPQCNSAQTDPVLKRGLKMANRSVGLNEHAHKQKYWTESSPPIMVLTMASATVSASPALAMAAWEPPLNAKKPKNKMNPPKAACCNQGNKTIMTYSSTSGAHWVMGCAPVVIWVFSSKSEVWLC